MIIFIITDHSQPVKKKKVKHHQSIYQGDKSTNWLNEDDLGTNNALLLLPASEIEEAVFEVAEDVP